MNVTNIASQFSRYAFIISALLVFGSISLNASANLIRNAGFETPISNTLATPDFDWLAFGSAGNPFNSNTIARNSGLMPRTGLQSLELQINNLTNSFAGVFQDIEGLTAGQSIVFSGWFKSLLDTGGVEIRIEWLNSQSGFEITRTPNLLPILTDQFSEFSISDFVPTGADTARVVYVVQSFTGANNQLVYIDDVSFEATTVSAPSILTLFGLGLIWLGLTRRHSAKI